MAPLPLTIERRKLKVVLLSPDNTNIIGGSVDHLESEQPAEFISSLTSRLEAAETHLNAPKTNRGRKASAKPAKPAATRTAPARSKAAATPQSRLTLKPSTFGSTARARHEASAGPSRQPRTDEDAREAARRARAEAILQLNQDPVSATARRNANRSIQSEDEYDIDEADDSFIQGVEAAEAEAVTRSRYFSQPKTAISGRLLPPKQQGHFTYAGRNGGGPQSYGFDDDSHNGNDDEYDFDDDSFFREIDEAEIIASATMRASSVTGQRAMASSGTSSAYGSKASRSTRSQPVEIIEISD